jgi:hypothetical protein
MTLFKQVGSCAMAAVWFGCQVPSDETTDDRSWAAMTPGGQTPVPYPNDSGLGYYEYLPEGYGTGTRFPIIIFFHDAPERGDGSLAELPRVLKHGPPKLIEGGKAFPAIVISPQIDIDSSWSPSITTPFVDYILNRYDVDLERIYFTGLSMGGEGTWLYAKANPGIPAAIVPICAPDNSTDYSLLRDLPTWTFHTLRDFVVPISETEDILAKVTGVRPVTTGNGGKTGYFQASSWSWRTGQAAPTPGENPTFTVYSGSGHDAWTAAYNNQAMWDWLFTRRWTLPPPSSDIVFQQSFLRSASVSDYMNFDAPTIAQFNDIGSQSNGGTFSINGQGRLQLVRAGSTDAATNRAAVTRWTDLAGPPAVLHASFDLGVSNWRLTPYQSAAMVMRFSRLNGSLHPGDGDVAAGTFQTVVARGRGPGRFTLAAEGFESAPLAADGTLHHVDVFLNKSGAAADYRAPDGSLQSLQDNGVALWVNGNAVVASAAASNGSESTLTDFRIRWVHGDDATWVLDNFLFRRTLPQ